MDGSNSYLCRSPVVPKARTASGSTVDHDKPASLQRHVSSTAQNKRLRPQVRSSRRSCEQKDGSLTTMTDSLGPRTSSSSQNELFSVLARDEVQPPLLNDSQAHRAGQSGGQRTASARAGRKKPSGHQIDRLYHYNKARPAAAEMET